MESSTKRLGKRKFGPSKSDNDVATARITAIPKKTLSDTKYCIGVWNEWCVHRAIKYGDIILPIGELTMEDLSRHLSRFILEVRKKDGREFPPESLHHVVCGIQRHLRFNGKPSVDFFKDSSFAELRMTLDAEMKRLQRSGLGSKKKKAEPITPEEEEIMWKKGILGESTPQALVDTMLYMSGLYFALRSGEEHRQLRFHQCQIQVIERPGERAYLQYTEETSKNRPGGLKNRKLKPKTVVHYANERNPNRCFVRLFKLYKSKCPTENLKKNAFYLQPLSNPSNDHVWYSTRPIGHDTLDKAVRRMCSLSGIPGFRTNHTLRATAATRLYQAGVDEQLVMEKTGHRSVEGVRSYKRTSEHQQQQISDILSGFNNPTTSLSLIQPLQQLSETQSVEQGNSGDMSINHSSTSKNLTMSFTQTPSFNIQGCMVTINNITHSASS